MGDVRTWIIVILCIFMKKLGISMVAKLLKWSYKPKYLNILRYFM